MKTRLLASLFGPLLVALLAATGRADEVDFAEYAELTSAAREAHQRLADSPPEAVTTRLEEARQRDLAVLNWLDRFLTTRNFLDLSATDQRLVLQDHDRTAYNLATVLLAQGRCDEAQRHVNRALTSVDDDQLRLLLLGTQAAVDLCLHDGQVTLTVDCEPADAEILLDDALLGPASDIHRVRRGPHRLAIRAPGYATESIDLDIAPETSEIHLGPILLIAEEAPGGPGIEWYEWTLWGAGAVGIATGIGYLVWANHRESELAEIVESGGLVLDPERERDVVDDLRLVGALSLTAGILSAAIGTILVLVDRPDHDPQNPQDFSWHLGTRGLSVDWRF